MHVSMTLILLYVCFTDIATDLCAVRTFLRIVQSSVLSGFIK